MVRIIIYFHLIIIITLAIGIDYESFKLQNTILNYFIKCSKIKNSVVKCLVLHVIKILSDL